MTTLETIVPFSGFYNTFHDAALDDAVNLCFSDYGTGNHLNDGLISRFWQDWEGGDAFRMYARVYTQCFADEFELPSLAFEQLDSPRFYNFETDRIFAKISLADLRSAVRRTDSDILKTLVKETLAPCSGFIPYYSNDINDWPQSARQWGHNQIGLLLRALAMTESLNGEFDAYREFELMEGPFSNGFGEELMSAGCSTFSRLWNIHDYLNQREARQAA